jgi:F-type H+-transporting ATPase subunit delta
MSTVIAKKYVSALADSMDDKSLVSTLASLASIVPAFANKKFNNILSSSDVSNEKRELFVLSLLDKPSEKLSNFIKLLSANGRLVDIPSIVKELSSTIALKNNQYEGLLISNVKIDEKEIKEIENNISKKLGSTIKLTNEVTDYPGMKVEVESLGIEISFSNDRLKSQIADHILKSL